MACCSRCESGTARALVGRAKITAAALAAVVITALVSSMAGAATSDCTNPITFCPCRIVTAGGVYTIAPAEENLIVTGPGDCIRIHAPNVTLNLGSSTITSSVSPSSFVGIHVLAQAPGAVVEGTLGAPAIVQDYGTGIQVDGSGATLKNLVAQSNGVGIFIDGAAAYGNALTVIGSVRIGILIKGSHAGPFLDGVSVSDTAGPGVKLNGVSGTFLTNLTVTANDTYGVWLRGSSRNVVADFTASQNTIAGVYLGCFASGGTLGGDCDIYPPVPPSNGNIIAGLSAPSSANGPIQPNQEYGVVIGNGNYGNRVVNVAGSGNGTGANGADAADYNPGCGTNVWRDNQFSTTIPPGPDSCIH